MGKVILGVFLGIGFLMFIGLVASTNSTKTATSQASSPTVAASENPAMPEPSMSVSAVKLWSDYQANEVAADNAYKNRRLAVSGQISGIKKDFMDKTYLLLASPNEFMDVHADLKGEYVSEAAGLRVGQMVVLDCDGGGMIVGSPVLRDCSIQHETPKETATIGSSAPQPEAQVALPNTVANTKPVYLPSARVKELMRQEELVNDKCRGGAGDDPATEKACTDRDALYDAIKAQGWCWGHEGQFGAEKDWEYCGPVAQ